MEQNILISTEIPRPYKWILKIYGSLLILVAIYLFVAALIDISKDENLYGYFYLAGMGGWFGLLTLPLLFFGPSISNLILGYAFYRLRKWSIILGSMYLIYSALLIFLSYNLDQVEPSYFEWDLFSILTLVIGIILPLIILILAIIHRKYLTGKYISIFPIILGIIIIYFDLIGSGLI